MTPGKVESAALEVALQEISCAAEKSESAISCGKNGPYCIDDSKTVESFTQVGVDDAANP